MKREIASAKIEPGTNTAQTIFGWKMMGGLHKAGKYKVSVWIHKNNYQNARFKQGYNGALQTFNGEVVHAGDWVQMNHYFERTSSQVMNTKAFAIASASGNVYADDLRVHPIEATMTSYVYDVNNQLTHILGKNNLATKYEYDNAGRLIRIYEELIDQIGLIGGIKLSEEYAYNYKGNNAGNNDNGCDPNVVSITLIEQNNGDLPTYGTLNAPAGTVLVLDMRIQGSNPDDGAATLKVNGTNIKTVTGNNPQIWNYTVSSSNPTLELDHYINPGGSGTNSNAVVLTISDVGDPCETEIGYPNTLSDVSNGLNDGGGGDPGLTGQISLNVEADDCDPNTPTCLACKTYTSQVFAIDGGSGEYDFEWEYRSNLYDWSSWGGNEDTIHFFYNINNSIFCETGNNYDWIQFRCKVTDSNDSSIYIDLNTPQYGFDCGCDAQ